MCGWRASCKYIILPSPAHHSHPQQLLSKCSKRSRMCCMSNLVCAPCCLRLETLAVLPAVSCDSKAFSPGRMSCLCLSWGRDVSQHNLCSLHQSLQVKEFVMTADVFRLSAATEKATCHSKRAPQPMGRSPLQQRAGRYQVRSRSHQI